MRKILFPVLTGLFSIILMASCESEMPSENRVLPEEAKAVNGWTYTTMKDNYFWSVKDSVSYNYTLQPSDFFNSIKNSNDTKYSSISPYQEAPATKQYDLGFEYSINNYSVNDKTYYVVLYTKPGSAAAQFLKRGHNIYEVNGENVTKDNSKTLLKNAINKGGTVSLKYTEITGSQSPDEVSVEIPVREIQPENPVYAKNKILLPTLTKQVGYIAYNKFDSQFDKQLMDSLQTLKDVNYLVLDLRYNAGGSLRSASYLGSALVGSDYLKEPFTIYQHENDKRKPSQDLVVNSFTINKETVIPIPMLDNLERIYVIIGKYTSQTSNIFINSLKGYWGDKLVLVGEPQQNFNDNNKRDDNLTFVKPTSKDGKWTLDLFFGYATNIKGEGYKVKPYPLGFTPNIQIEDINPTKLEEMFNLGNENERILKTILADIRGLRSISNSEITTIDSYRHKIISSIEPIPTYIEIE